MFDGPSLRINTAFWSYPGDPVRSDEGTNVGALTDPGIFGLFYPTRLGRVDISMLKQPSMEDYQRFHVYGNHSLKTPLKPTQCKNHTCIPILASDKNTEFENAQEIEKLIEDEHLFVEVVWVSNLSEKVKDLYKANKPFIILHVSPSDITNSDIDFTPISLPRHKRYHLEAYTIGKYFFKHDSSGTLSPDSFDSATRTLGFLKIPDATFSEIFQNKRNLTESEMYCKVAKGIVEAKRYDIQTALPKSNITMLIGGIYPQDGTQITHVLDLATNVINNDVMSHEFSIKIQWRNGGCQADQVLRYVIEYFNVGKIFGILGPACSETIQPIAGISRYLNIPIISYAAEAPVFDQDIYPYFFRTIGSNRQYEDVFIQFFRIFEWKRFATITEEGQKSTEYIINMEKKIKKEHIDSIADIKVTKQMNASDISYVSIPIPSRKFRALQIPLFFAESQGFKNEKSESHNRTCQE